jgi:hypothetical protein
MEAAVPEAPNLTNDQLREVLGLIEGADSVELKLTVPDDDHRSTVQGLDMDPLDAYLRQVVFFDTPGLDLERAGVVVRARRSQGRPDDSVVKLRPVAPDELPAEVRSADGFGVEVDAMPGGFVCSGSFKRRLKAGRVREVLRGERRISKLFSREQRAFYEEHAPDGIGLDDLAVLGPLPILKLKYKPEGYARKLVAEGWLYPDGSRILELSTKCEPGEAFQVAAETRAFLSGHGIPLSGEQQTKTRTALEYFAGQLNQGPEAPARRSRARTG